MPNVIKITVENPDEILNAGAYGAGAVIRLQTSATEAGAFADVSGTGSTPTIPVVTLIRSYTGYDPLGIVSSWYRTRYENAGATRLSDWSPAFQVGDENAGLLCSLYDVQQELGESGTDANRNELILEKIRQVSAAIELSCQAWLAPRPTNPASEMTLLFDVPYASRSLYIQRGDRRLGIRTASAIGIATQSQPESGGTYTSATLATVLLRPRPTADGPAWRLEFSDTSGGYFYAGYNTVQVTGSFGPASVPADIQGVALRATVRRVMGKGAGAVGIPIGPEGTMMLLPDLSGADRATLEMYRVPAVA
ncbi:MAG TPA: hypothetical protein VNN79_20755 [Actinomycetota bacterium]|nr:hypothetical protein [Actinomycetota bacterium]